MNAVYVIMLTCFTSKSISTFIAALCTPMPVIWFKNKCIVMSSNIVIGSIRI